MTTGASPTTSSSDDWKTLAAERARRDQLKALAESSRLELECERRAAERGRASLAHFMRAAWHIVEPGRPLLWGWHLDAICDHLEAVTRGDLTNLLITIPPGTTKSRTVCVFWPAWNWQRHLWPEARWLFISNTDDLATRDSLACRRLLESDWYQKYFPDAPRITTDQNTKTWIENDRGGHRQSLGIKANVTGKKGDLIVVDDANDAEKVESAADRNMINRRWGNAIYDRVINFKTGRRLVVGQRTHKQDLIGHIQATGGFEELRIPEELELTKRCRTAIGYCDPRTKDKLARATPAIVFAESKRLWLPSAETARAIGFPLDAVISELTAFTGDDKKDEHDDIADNLSYAVECHQQGPTSRSGGAPGVWLPKGLRLWAAGG